MKLTRAQAKAMGLDVPASKRIKPPLLGEQAKMVWLTLPWPPTVNTYWRHAGSKTYISKGGRQYREEAVQSIRCGQNASHVKGRLTVKIWAFPPDKRQRDLDNILKCVLDVLQHAGVYEDDSQIDNLMVHRMAGDSVGGKLVVSITGDMPQ